MALIKGLWDCTFSPKLYKVHEVNWKTYEPNSFERWGDNVVNSFAAIWSISLYALPVMATFMYRRNYSLAENIYTLSKIAVGAGFILVASLAVRGYNRINSPIYLKFLNILTKAKKSYNHESKQELLKYDFEFWAWPADFKVSTLEKTDGRKRIVLPSSSRISRLGGKDLLLAVPCKVASYIIANTIALKLMYPGSMTLINMAMKPTMIQGRADLLDLGGQRSKLITQDQNLEIDTMLIDRRQKSLNGHILVITCEGNCGFYETGIMSTPVNKGFSVLGWNHPGFGGSTGSPFPEAEIDGMDAVIKFAIEKLGFPENRLIIYGWSIGGYTATWAAMNYPDIHGLVLDATFDDVLPLAMSRMPSAIDGLVKTVIREYFNLNVAEQLKKYAGRVLLVRRTDDEIMCTPTNYLSDNRANVLVSKLLAHRYPKLFADCRESLEVLNKYLASPAHYTNGTTKPLSLRTERLFNDENLINENLCIEKIKNNLRNDGSNYPSTLGDDCDSATKQQLVIYLASKYMEDQASQHCSPLLGELFHPGWDPQSILQTPVT